MDRIVLWPFYSQQDKQTKKFAVTRDSGFKAYRALAHRLAGEYHVTFVLPHASQIEHGVNLHLDCEHYHLQPQPLDNLDRKLHWDTFALRDFGASDMVITTHEFAPIPLRALHPELAIIVEGILPMRGDPDLYGVAQTCATAVECRNQYIAYRVAGRKKFVWQFGCDVQSFASLRGNRRPIDVVFNSRVSVTQYNKHTDVVDAVKDTGLLAVFTDPTQLRDEYPSNWSVGKLDDAGYRWTLSASKVAVFLNDSGYVGTSFYEAVAAGCCPVVPDAPQYRAILGDSWPYYVRGDLRSKLLSAVDNPKQVPTEFLMVADYKTAAEQAYRDIGGLL